LAQGTNSGMVEENLGKSMISVDTVLQLCSDVRFRTLDDEGVVVRQEAGEVIALNEVGANFLKLVDGQRSVADIIAQLQDVFDVDTESLRKDIIHFASELEQAGVVTTL